MNSYCLTCHHLRTEDSDTEGKAYYCTFNPNWMEIFGPSERYCGRWFESEEVTDRKAKELAEIEQKLAADLWRIKHEVIMRDLTCSKEKAKEMADLTRIAMGIKPSLPPTFVPSVANTGSCVLATSTVADDPVLDKDSLWRRFAKKIRLNG